MGLFPVRTPTLSFPQTLPSPVPQKFTCNYWKDPRVEYSFLLSPIVFPLPHRPFFRFNYLRKGTFPRLSCPSSTSQVVVGNCVQSEVYNGRSWTRKPGPLWTSMGQYVSVRTENSRNFVTVVWGLEEKTGSPRGRRVGKSRPTSPNTLGTWVFQGPRIFFWDKEQKRNIRSTVSSFIIVEFARFEKRTNTSP